MERCPYCGEMTASTALHVFSCEKANPPIPGAEEKEGRFLEPESIYLCGAINDIPEEEARSWRSIATLALSPYFLIRDPMQRIWVPGMRDGIGRAAYLVEEDKQDVLRSDILLIDGRRPSWGAAMELYLASKAGKDLFAFTTLSQPPMSFWVSYHGVRILPSLEASLEILVQRGKDRAKGVLR